MAEAVARLVEQLARARRAQGVTQAAVAETLELSAVAVSGWECGADVPTPENLVWWARALGYAVLLVDVASGRWLAPGPAPRASESPEGYWLRCTVLTLRAARREAGLTQEQIGDRLGVSAWTVAQWEAGSRVPRLPRLVEWCAVLGCRLELRRC